MEKFRIIPEFSKFPFQSAELRYISSMKPKKSGPGRPSTGPKKRLSVDIRPELRAMVDEFKRQQKYTLNVAVEVILESYFATHRNQSMN